MLKTMQSLVCIGFLAATSVRAQTKDSILEYRIDDIIITLPTSPENISRLGDIQNGYIHAGKKNEVLQLEKIDANITDKTARQIFAKIPGLFVYDMDGNRNQINISTRGLDAHRGWEFNIRKDGIMTNSDIYGYPASHYNMPLESVERIELVRGTGALQYGAQFGGMLNYISKTPDTSRRINYETINAIGSFGLLSTYHNIGGKINNLTFSAYISRKISNGYRDNAQNNALESQIMLKYQIMPNMSITAEWAHSEYIYRIAGAQTDSMFYANPRAATRSRNYFNPNIHVPSVKLDWKIGKNTNIYAQTSAVLGARNSVMFDKPANIADTISSSTQQYSNRQVDIDNFNSYTTELRLLQHYQLFRQQQSSFVFGAQYIHNTLHRRQQGRGTTGADFDLTLVDTAWGRNMYLQSQNIAFFLENSFKISPRWRVNIGGRVEIGNSRLSGRVLYLPDESIKNNIKHKYPLFGISSEYALSSQTAIYGGLAQAYRPIIFKDIVPASLYEQIDTNLQDAFGFNAELGFRGSWHGLRWDISAFYLQYNNRLGNLAQVDSNGVFYTYRTNIGNSATQGIELFFEHQAVDKTNFGFSYFTSSAYMNAQYQNASIKQNNVNIDISGNKVESVPTWSLRSGATFRYKILSLSLLHSFVSQTFADAFNTVEANANAAVGLVPAYHLFDANATIKINSKITLRAAANNIFNRQYFTKRPSFYPGVGIWAGDGRSFNISVALKL
jgi:Fe(3+) dicitrate transport protein